ncbi:MAG: hypothetical protein CMN30_01080 [Sandaracinus sp.]|nr:hypothetical protein [Sandaracinus sp.]|tara:strand:+ start:920 stop:1894 length:975 start_codon:yes stop_codon:yes gene_type:complete
MMRSTIFSVSLLLATGCFGLHGSDDDGSSTDDIGDAPPPRDMGPRDMAPRPVDLPVYLDSTPPPVDFAVEPGCGPEAFDVSCGTRAVPANVPFELPVSIGGPDRCYCGERVSCSVETVDAPTGLEVVLHTAICADDLLCDGCFPYIEGSCALPALAPGVHQVWVDDGSNRWPVFSLAAGSPAAGEICRTPAEPDECRATGISELVRAGEICHPETARAGARETITVVDQCGTCGDTPGVCHAWVDTTALVPTVAVEPTMKRSDCAEGCPTVCMRREYECVLPELEPGTVYQVAVNGPEGRRLGFSLPVTDEGPRPSEVCEGPTD